MTRESSRASSAPTSEVLSGDASSRMRTRTFFEGLRQDDFHALPQEVPVAITGTITSTELIPIVSSLTGITAVAAVPVLKRRFQPLLHVSPEGPNEIGPATARGAAESHLPTGASEACEENTRRSELLGPFQELWPKPTALHKGHKTPQRSI